jgi:hypothetical protein
MFIQVTDLQGKNIGLMSEFAISAIAPPTPNSGNKKGLICTIQGEQCLTALNYDELLPYLTGLPSALWRKGHKATLVLKSASMTPPKQELVQVVEQAWSCCPCCGSIRTKYRCDDCSFPNCGHNHA